MTLHLWLITGIIVAAVLLGAVGILLVRRRKNLKSLRDMDEKLRALVEDAPAGEFIVQDGRFVYANRWIIDFLGYSKEELLSIDHVLKLVHPDEDERAKKIYNDLHTGIAGCSKFEIRGVRKDGETVQVEMHVISSRYKGRPALIGSVIDITERKELEQRQRDFIAMVTHDLKTPLTSIIGFSEIMLGMGLEPEARDMAETVLHNGNRVLEMVNNFLTVSRVESGALRLNLAPHDPEDMLWDLQQSFSPIARQKGVRLEADVAPIKKALLDRAHMERAVANLLQNAIYYSGRNGTVKLSACSGKRPADGRRVNPEFLAISVSDSGPGIKPEDADKVFEKYYQSTGAARGAGLGLAVVKAVAEAHGGRAAVESIPGKGSTFKIFLPLRGRA